MKQALIDGLEIRERIWRAFDYLAAKRVGEYPKCFKINRDKFEAFLALGDYYFYQRCVGEYELRSDEFLFCGCIIRRNEPLKEVLRRIEIEENLKAWQDAIRIEGLPKSLTKPLLRRQ